MNNEKLFKIKKNIYSKNILLRTCYNFIEKYYIYLDDNKDEWIIKLKCKDNNTNKNLEKIEGEFNNLLLNESFRDTLSENTKTIKEIIVARALYGADKSDNLTSFSQDKNNKNGKEKDGFSDENISFFEEDSDDYLEDPLGIAIPWEEKYSKDNKDSNIKDEQ